MSRVAEGIDSTLLWAARIVGLFLLAGLVYLAFKVLVGAFVVLIVFAALLAFVVVIVRRRTRR